MTNKVAVSMNLADVQPMAIELAEHAIALSTKSGHSGAEAFVRAVISLTGAIVEVSSTGGDIHEVVAIAKGAMDRWVELVEGKTFTS